MTEVQQEAELVEKYKELLTRYANRAAKSFCSTIEPDDLLQGAQLALLRIVRRKLFDPSRRASFKTFLIHVVIQEWRSLAHQEARNRQRVTFQSEYPHPLDLPPDLTTTDFLDHVLQGVSTLAGEVLHARLAHMSVTSKRLTDTHLSRQLNVSTYLIGKASRELRNAFGFLEGQTYNIPERQSHLTKEGETRMETPTEAQADVGPSQVAVPTEAPVKKLTQTQFVIDLLGGSQALTREEIEQALKVKWPASKLTCVEYVLQEAQKVGVLIVTEEPVGTKYYQLSQAFTMPKEAPTTTYWVQAGTDVIELTTAGVRKYLADRNLSPGQLPVMSHDQASGWKTAADFNIVPPSRRLDSTLARSVPPTS